MAALKRIGLSTVFVAVTSFALAGAAYANVITGKLWHVPEATTLSAIPANVPGFKTLHFPIISSHGL